VLTSADGETVSAWFDKESGLLLQEEVPVPQIGASVISKYSDYREVGGVKMAYMIEQEGPMPFIIEYTDVRVNADDIPEDAFEVPQGIKDLAVE
jgi:hypothetical protein